MKKRFEDLVAVLLTFALITFAASGEIQAAMVLYDNGPIAASSDGAWSIGLGAVSNSFDLSGPSHVSEIFVGLWAWTDSTPASLNWAIGSAPFGTDLGVGTNAPLSNTLYGSFVTGDKEVLPVYQSSFAVDLSLAAGRYFLTLSNGFSTGADNNLYWDINRGPSSAYLNQVIYRTDSESFQILGTTAASPVPEPSSGILLAGLGAMALLARTVRRRLRIAT